MDSTEEQQAQYDANRIFSVKDKLGKFAKVEYELDIKDIIK